MIPRTQEQQEGRILQIIDEAERIERRNRYVFAAFFIVAIAGAVVAVMLAGRL